MAGPIILELFEVVNRDDERRDLLLRELGIINQEIRRFNATNTIDVELGTIDIDTFLFAWSKSDSGPLLEEFCQLHYYPTQWACRPPVIGGGYQPCPDKYWKSCDWDTAGMLLGFVWDLRRAQKKDEIIEDQELILLEFEPNFNGSLSKLHKAHGRWGSTNHFLHVEELLRDYKAMIQCLESNNQACYEKCRRNFRAKCSLYEYPREWVPGNYNREKGDM